MGTEKHTARICQVTHACRTHFPTLPHITYIRHSYPYTVLLTYLYAQKRGTEERVACMRQVTHACSRRFLALHLPSRGPTGPFIHTRQGSPQKSVKAYGTSHELIYLFQPAFTMDKPTILREHGRILCALHAHDLSLSTVVLSINKKSYEF